MDIMYYQDPGHGWFEVPIPLLRELGIADKITPYSYQKDDSAYLEEDLDASTFIHAAEAVGLSLQIIEVHEKDLSPIRNYRQYGEGEKA